MFIGHTMRTICTAGLQEQVNDRGMESSILTCSVRNPFQPDLSVHHEADDTSFVKFTVTYILQSEESVLSFQLPELPQSLFLEAPSTLS
jgi:hypothetical protein